MMAAMADSICRTRFAHSLLVFRANRREAIVWEEPPNRITDTKSSRFYCLELFVYVYLNLLLAQRRRKVDFAVAKVNKSG